MKEPRSPIEALNENQKRTEREKEKKTKKDWRLLRPRWKEVYRKASRKRAKEISSFFPRGTTRLLLEGAGETSVVITAHLKAYADVVRKGEATAIASLFPRGTPKLVLDGTSSLFMDQWVVLNHGEPEHDLPLTYCTSGMEYWHKEVRFLVQVMIPLIWFDERIAGSNKVHLWRQYETIRFINTKTKEEYDYTGKSRYGVGEELIVHAFMNFGQH